MEVSVAFQGGGARVIELMAAAKACRSLESHSFKIFRVSGASAGAIAGAMLATGCDIDAVVADHAKLKRIVERHFPVDRLRKRMVLWRLIRGKPIFDEKALREVIISLFSLGGVDAERPIRDLVRPGLELRILRSNIRYHNTSIATERSEYALWEALADSAAIPFAFRMPGGSTSRPEILDGGLFQNLPATAATENLGSNQVPLGFSFESEDTPDLRDASLKGYASAIVASLLNERIADSVFRLKPTNIVKIPNRRRTFDFTSVFTEDLPRSFNETVDQLKIQIEAWKSSIERMDGPDWYSEHPDDLREHIRRTDQDVMEFFEQVSTNGYHAEEVHHRVIFRSHDHREPDLCELEVRLLGSKNPGLQFMRFWFYDSETGPLKRAQIEVTDNDGKPLPGLTFPIRNTGRARARSILLVLPQPLQSGDEIVIRKSEETFNSMLDYVTKGLNFQTLAFGRGRSADLAKLSVQFPKRWVPSFHRNASPDQELEKDDFKGETGLQVEAEFSISKERGGAVTVAAQASLPVDGAEHRRFVKVVYCKHS